MAQPAQKRMSLAEFLQWDDGTDTRYELIGGVVVAMAPPAPRHGAIASNLNFEIRSRLRLPCRIITEAGLVPPQRANTYYQADLAVTCAPELPEHFVEEPVVVAEVLSPSTTTLDRTLKLADYRGIASMREILLVWSRERRAECWRREGERWIVEDLIGDALIRLESVGMEIPLAALYVGVTFPALTA